MVPDRHGGPHAHERTSDRPRSRYCRENKVIGAASTQTILPVWTADEAGPSPTRPCPGGHGRPQGEPARDAHEYVRAGTAKQVTLFHPATGEVRVRACGRARIPCSTHG